MSRIAPSPVVTQSNSTTAQTTPNSMTVTTASGLNQGDLVYYNNGDYKSPANITAPTTSTFNAIQAQGVYSGGTGGYGVPVFSNTDMLTTNAYGASSCQAMAVLTNGNIVQVFKSYNSNYPSFRIVNSSGAIVVAATAISTTSNNNACNIAVCALTGGGFAVMYTNSSSNPVYAVYTNSGTVTTAATADALPSGTVASYIPFYLTALANGGFAAVTVSSGWTLYFKIYTSTGGATTSWTTPWAQPSSAAASFGVASRSDSSICIVGYTSNTIYAVYNASGTAIVSPTLLATTGYQRTNDVACLADGTTFVIAYQVSATGYLAVQLLPAGNVLGSSITIARPANTQVSSSISWVRLLAQSSGGFAFFYTDDNTGALSVGFSNSSATAFYPATNANGVVPVTFPQYILANLGSNARFKGTAYELGGNVYFGITSAFNANTSNFLMVSVNETTYQQNLNSNATVISNTSPATVTSATGSIALPAITPTKFSYYPASTTSTNAILNPTTILSSQILDYNASSNICSTTLTDGRFAIAYYNNSTDAVTVKVFSPAGSLLTTLSPGSVGTAGTFYTAAIKLFPLASGKLGVLILNSGVAVQAYIYSSTYSLLYSTAALTFTAPYSNTFYNDGTYAVDGCTLTDRFAVAYNNTSNQQQLAIFDNTLTPVTNVYLTTASANSTLFKVVASQTGGFFVQFYYSGTPSNFYFYVQQTGASTYSSVASFTDSSTYGLGQTQKPMILGGTSVVIPYPSQNSNNSLGAFIGDIYYGSIYATKNANYFSTTSSATATNIGNWASNTSGAGYPNFAGVVTTGASGSMTIYGFAPGIGPSANQPVASSLTVSASLYATAPQLSITAGPGYSVVVSYSDANQYPNFMIVNATALNVPTTITAGSTTSVPISVSGNPVNTGGIANTVLVGVANTTAAANSSVSLTTNGSAQLNSNYSASTPYQAFDYQIPNGTAIQGVKGLISGRNVTLFGNN